MMTVQTGMLKHCVATLLCQAELGAYRVRCKFGKSRQPNSRRVFIIEQLTLHLRDHKLRSYVRRT